MVSKKKKNDEPEPNFAFKKVEQDIDKIFEDKEKKEEEARHISEKIREGIEIKENLPTPDFLNVKVDEVEVITKKKDEEGNEQEEKERGVQIASSDVDGEKHVSVVKGLFELNLRDDATWWFLRTPILNPQIYKQAIRTHLDIKKCHEPEKRRLEVPYLLIIVLLIGAAIIAFSFLTLVMK